MIRLIVLTLALLSVAGCWNVHNESLHLGDVSMGQQLIDLKRALAEEAITEAEYDIAKQQLLAGEFFCDDEDSDDIEIRIGDDE